MGNPTCMYRKGESKIFDSPEDVPKGEGWQDTPVADEPDAPDAPDAPDDEHEPVAHKKRGRHRKHGHDDEVSDDDDSA